LNLKMKLFLSLSTLILLQSLTSWFGTAQIVSECINSEQLLNATVLLCMQRPNKALWKKIIDCHKPISNKFLRHSAEARCPYPSEVDDPTDCDYTIEQVFF